MLDIGFNRRNTDHSVFVKKRKESTTIFFVYVDDIFLTDDDTESIRELQKYNGKVFDIKDLGPLKYFLGIEVARSQKGIFISQRKYTLDLLEVGVKPTHGTSSSFKSR